MAYGLGLTHDERETAKMPLALLLLAVARKALRSFPVMKATPHNLDTLRHAFRSLLIAMADEQVFSYFDVWDSGQMRYAPIGEARMARMDARYPGQVVIDIDPLVAWLLRGGR